MTSPDGARAPEAPRPAPPADEGDLLDPRLLRDWAGFALGAVRRRKLLAAACFAALAGGGVVALEVLPRRYEVQARILAQPNPLFLEFNQFDAPTRAARETILRRDNLTALLRQTDFVARHEAARAPAARAKEWVFRRLRGPRTPEQRLDDSVDAVEERLRVSVTGGDTVELSFQWSSAELAFDVVQAAVESFLEARHASEVAAIGETISILEDHAGQVNRDVTEQTKRVEGLEAEIRAAQRGRGIVRRPRVLRDVELVRLEARLGAKRRALAAVEELRARRLSELQAELAQQQVIYAERHPALDATRRSMAALSGRSAQGDALRGEIAELEREVSERFPGSAAPLVDPLAPASAELAVETLEEDPRLDYERHRLWLLVRQHTSLLERIDSARVLMDTARAGFKYRYTVVKPPRMPKGYVKPNAAKLLLAGAGGGVLLAVLACVAADLASGVVVERWQVERQLGVPVLAAVRRKR